MLSIGAARVSQPIAMNSVEPIHHREWIEIERPFPAFALSIPEAADVPASYAIRRHAEGNGRKDILVLGDADSAAPYLQVEIYRPGSEIRRFADAEQEIIAGAAALAPIDVKRRRRTAGEQIRTVDDCFVFNFATEHHAAVLALRVPTMIHACNSPDGFVRAATS